MLYPAETSLISVTVALARFLESEGLPAFGMNYPYWYFGTTPFKFLVSPILSSLMVVLHKIIPIISLFDIAIVLIAISFAVGGIGWIIFAERIFKSQFSIYKKIFFLAIFLIFPWKYLVGFGMTETSVVIAKNLLPWILFFPRIWTITILLLVNTNILSSLVIGLIALSFTKKQFTRYLKKMCIITLVSLVLVTLWYSPGYWMTILFNPSIGGITGGKMLIRVIDLFRSFLPILLAIFVVFFSGKLKKKSTAFILAWTIPFLILTGIRFIGDPDFWMDWTSWLYEIEIGIFLYIASKLKTQSTNIKIILNFKILNIKKIILCFFICAFSFSMTFFAYRSLGSPKLISEEIPYGVRSLKEVSRIVGGKTTFLSGSTVFWADALYNIRQVRGGRDEVSVHLDWDKIAYSFREGASPEYSDHAQYKLVEWVLVHTETSKEFYHDFKNVWVWENVGKLVWRESGDLLYKLSF